MPSGGLWREITSPNAVGPQSRWRQFKGPQQAHAHTHAAVLSSPEQFKLNTETLPGLPWPEEELPASSEPNKHFLTMGKYDQVKI